MKKGKTRTKLNKTRSVKVAPSRPDVNFPIGKTIKRWNDANSNWKNHV